MFTYDAIDESLYSGVSPDRVPDSLKNRFSMVFGSDYLDYRLQVVISERQVGFFYYDSDYETTNPWNPGEVKDNDYVREVGFITLTRPKDTGNDILGFPQNIDELSVLDDANVHVLESMKECIRQREEEYSSFPFMDMVGNIGEVGSMNLYKRKELFRCFLRCCLLDFIYDFEDRGQAFGASPLYDCVREKLRESDVYKMLSAKLNYIQYLYKDVTPKNQEKYTFHANKFADCLMSARLNKVISPDNYGASDGKQGWFYNPEKELESILEKNRNSDDNVASLNNSLVAKVRSFFYTKHSVYCANTTEKSKKWFKCAQVAMLFFNILSVIALLFYEKAFCGFFYKSLYLIGVLAIVIVGASIWISAKENDNNGKINAFFPRIIVAEAAAWLTIGISEDLVKSMLWSKRVWIAMVLVLILVGILIYSEVKQHSPYSAWRNNVIKTSLIMNHSLFFALVLGGITQSVFYDKLLRTSNVLSDVVYKDHFDKVENYIQQLESWEKSINEYQRFAQDYCMSLSDVGGDNSGVVKLKGQAFGKNDTLNIVLDNNKLVIRSAFSSSFKSEQDVVSYHGNLIEAVNAQQEDLKAMMNKTSCDTILNLYDSLLFSNVLQKNDSNSLENDIKENYDKNRRRLLNIRKEIQVSKKHCMDDGYNTLLNWTTVDYKNDQTGSPFLDMLISSEKNEKCCREVGWGVPRNGHRFYPTLLLMHTLIVLVIAFITQLIISDKSVTEPL